MVDGDGELTGTAGTLLQSTNCGNHGLDSENAKAEKEPQDLTVTNI